MSEFLLELRTDGLPHDFVPAGVNQLKRVLVQELRRRDVAPRQSATSFTGRRMLVLLRGLGGGESDEARRRALVESIPLALSRVLWPTLLPHVGESPPFVRPLRAVLAVLDGEPVRIDELGATSVGTTIGHPIHSPEPFAVSDATDYARKLAARGIEIQVSERRKRLRARLEAALVDVGGGHILGDEVLLEELVGSLEIPGAVAGEFDRAYLDLPRELLVSCLGRRHRSFAVAETVDSAQLRPLFVTAMDREDDPEGVVRRGQERVLESHLLDLRHRFDEDRRTPLAERRRRWLAEPGREAEGERCQRVAALAVALCRDLGWQDQADLAEEAVALLDADLGSQLVQQLPELRGTVGGLLAREEGYPESVWQGVYDHRLPSAKGSAIPRGRVGKAVALALRLESLASARSDDSAGPPTGELESTGVGVVQIVLQGGVELDLDLAAARAMRLSGRGRGAALSVGALRDLLDRCTRIVLSRAGYLDDEIEAVMEASGSRLLPQIEDRLEVLHRARREPEFARVVHAARRLLAVLGDAREGRVDAELLEEPAERDLWRQLRTSREAAQRALGAKQPERWLGALLSLTESLERFLAEVLVRDEDESLRHNRLALLQGVHRVFSRQVRLAELDDDEAGSTSS